MTPAPDPRGDWIANHMQYVPYTAGVSPMCWIVEVGKGRCVFAVDSPDSWVEDFACAPGQTVAVPYSGGWFLRVVEIREGAALVALTREAAP